MANALAPYFLYRALNGDGEVIYIGITNNVGARTGQHAATKRWWQEVASLRIDTFDDRAQAQAAERDAIQLEQPKYNVTHGPAERRPDKIWPQPVAPDQVHGNEFTSTAKRSGNMWQVQCDQYPQAVSLVRRLDLAESAQCEAVAFVLSTSRQHVTLRYLHVDLDEDMIETVNQREQALRAADEANQAAAESSRRAVASLHDRSGLPLRDIAHMLSVSLARAQQLLAESRGAKRQRGRQKIG